MREQRGRIGSLTFTMLFASICSMFAGAYTQETVDATGASAVRQLEIAFSSARDLKAVHEVANLPKDVIQKVLHINRGFAVADLGAQWSSSGQSDNRNSATAQHIFSAVSDGLFFVLLNMASEGFRPSGGVVLVLGSRQSDSFCTYSYGVVTTWRLRLDSFQSEFSSTRVTPREGPACVVRKLDENR